MRRRANSAGRGGGADSTKLAKNGGTGIGEDDLAQDPAGCSVEPVSPGGSQESIARHIERTDV